MELCDGGSVADWMARRGGRLPLAQALPVMRQALEGLAHAHREGFVHRDLKPGNLLLARAERQVPHATRSPSASAHDGGCARESAARCGATAMAGDGANNVPRSYERSHGEQIFPDGSEGARRAGDGEWIAKIGDFGMAKSFQLAGLSGMTVTGDRGGTPQFMPREQVVNFRQVKPASDVWSLGATFYFMLTGQTPRDFPPGTDPIEVVLDGHIVPLRERDETLPTKLAAVIDRALATKPQARFQDASEFLRALESAS
jgi:serine/threonine protein kinase